MEPIHNSQWVFNPPGESAYKGNPARYVGSTNMTDIYIDVTLREPGLILVNASSGSSLDWHWAEINHKIKRVVSCGHPRFPLASPPDEWFQRFMEDRENIEAYLRCFVPEFSGGLS